MAEATGGKFDFDMTMRLAAAPRPNSGPVDQSVGQLSTTVDTNCKL